MRACIKAALGLHASVKGGCVAVKVRGGQAAKSDNATWGVLLFRVDRIWAGLLTVVLLVIKVQNVRVLSFLALASESWTWPCLSY